MKVEKEVGTGCPIIYLGVGETIKVQSRGVVMEMYDSANRLMFHTNRPISGQGPSNRSGFNSEIMYLGSMTVPNMEHPSRERLDQALQQMESVEKAMQLSVDKRIAMDQRFVVALADARLRIELAMETLG